MPNMKSTPVMYSHNDGVHPALPSSITHCRGLGIYGKRTDSADFDGPRSHTRRGQGHEQNTHSIGRSSFRSVPLLDGDRGGPSRHLPEPAPDSLAEVADSGRGAHDAY